MSLEEKAKAANKGIHSNTPGLVRKVSPIDPVQLFNELKGTPLNGIVESIRLAIVVHFGICLNLKKCCFFFCRTGNFFRITLIPSYQEITTFLSGVKCPEVKPDGSFVGEFTASL